MHDKAYLAFAEAQEVVSKEQNRSHPAQTSQTEGAGRGPLLDMHCLMGRTARCFSALTLDGVSPQIASMHRVPAMVCASFIRNYAAHSSQYHTSFA